MVEQDIRRFAEKVIGNLKARFPEGQLVKAFEIFNPKKIPKEKVLYGEEEITLLSEKYSIVNKDEALIEWEGFKHRILTNYQSFNTLDLLCLLVTEVSLVQLYPNLACLAKIVLVSS